MTGTTAPLFKTVSSIDHLHFWSEQDFRARSVAEFLNLKNAEIANISGVSLSSVRFDGDIPHDVQERLEEIANICNLVAGFFGGDAQKTALWFRTKNPMLGDISPRDMIRFGRYNKLRRFIISAQAEGDVDHRSQKSLELTRAASSHTEALAHVKADAT